VVEIRTVTEAPAAVVAWSTTWRAFRNEWQPALDEVWTVVREHDRRTDGHNVMLLRRHSERRSCWWEICGDWTENPARYETAVFCWLR
jgi:hypothetical protein